MVSLFSHVHSNKNDLKSQVKVYETVPVKILLVTSNFNLNELDQPPMDRINLQ